MKVTRAFLGAALAMVFVGAFAQGAPPGGGRGPGGFGPGPMGGVEPAERLVMRSDVQTDLELTDDQRSQLQALRASMRPPGGFGGPGGGGQGGPGGPPPDGGPGQGGPGQGGPGGGPGGTQIEAMRKKVEAILTADQKTRLKGITIQLAGNAAALSPEIAKDLGLSETQNSKIKSLSQKLAEANRAVFDKARDGEISGDEVRGILQQNTQILKDEIGKILTDDQKAKLKTMAGKPFKATQQSGGFGGPGFGGPGGPGGFGGPGGGTGGGGGGGQPEFDPNGGPGGGPGGGGPGGGGPGGEPGGPPPGGGPGGPPPGEPGGGGTGGLR